MSTYAGKDPVTNILLDMIAEKESAGNYNAVIGNARAKDNLSKYTIKNIYTLMSRLLRQGQPSTAVGRYQIIRTTLKSLQNEENVLSGDYFTPELQDRLAVALMVRRGYSAWWRKQISDEEFAHRLSMEWASLPDPRNGGKSHYDGVGANHAGMTLSKFYAGLRRAREAQ